MLGVRLDSDTERRLTALARRQRRSKSDIAREALIHFIESADNDGEFARQIILAAAADVASGGDDEDVFAAGLVAAALDDEDLADESFVRGSAVEKS